MSEDTTELLAERLALRLSDSLGGIHSRITEMGKTIASIETQLATRGGIIDRVEKLEVETETNKTFRVRLIAYATILSPTAGIVAAKFFGEK